MQKAAFRAAFLLPAENADFIARADARRNAAAQAGNSPFRRIPEAHPPD